MSSAQSATRSRRKFLRYYPGGFRDADYLELERGYKWQAHLRWHEALGPRELRALLRARKYAEVAARAVRIEARTNLLFSFEKMALRDAVRSPAGARTFAHALDALLNGTGDEASRFDAWCAAVAELPRKQTRVLTWPVVTVFAFLAQPAQHFYFKPMVTRRGAEAYGQPLPYRSRPSWDGYAPVLELAKRIRREQRELRPRDMIDLQGFLWVLGSDEYP